MAVAGKITDLSVDPPVFEIGSNDNEFLGFDAMEAIALVSATLRNMRTFEVVSTPATILGTVATAQITGLVRGDSYELSVTFTNAALRKWTRTLLVRCVS